MAALSAVLEEVVRPVAREGRPPFVAREVLPRFVAPQATQPFAVLEGLPRSAAVLTMVVLITAAPTTVRITAALASLLVQRSLAQRSELRQRQLPTIRRRITARRRIAAITPILPVSWLQCGSRSA